MNEDEFGETDLGLESVSFFACFIGRKWKKFMHMYMGVRLMYAGR